MTWGPTLRTAPTFPTIPHVAEVIKVRVMANPEHIKWLLEGVESWNARREQKDFKPDFEGANIYEEFQKSEKLDEDGYIPLA